MLRKTIVALAACFLIAGKSLAAPEATGDAGWTPYQEPSESAFTTEVPKGWQIEAGTARKGAAKATPWLKATSPDGQTTIFNGSPSLPQFVIPGRLSGAEGKSFTGPGGTTVTFHYQTGKEFASTYGSHLLPAGCEKIELIRAQDEPELHERLRQKNPQLASNTSAGSAMYSYNLGGQKSGARDTEQASRMESHVTW